MPEPPQVAADVDARLAEIDRRLREIQAELLPDRQPRPSPEPPPARKPPPAPEPPPARQPRPGHDAPSARAPQSVNAPPSAAGSGSLTDLAALSEPQARLLSSIRELLEAYQWLLARMRTDEGAQAGPAGGEFAVSAGPFASIDAVRDFERALSALPGVGAVALRGYEGDSRAILDVQLARRTPLP